MRDEHKVDLLTQDDPRLVAVAAAPANDNTCPATTAPAAPLRGLWRRLFRGCWS